MPEPLTLEHANMLASRLDGRGLDDGVLADSAARFRDIHDDVEQRRTDGDLGFFDLPYQENVVEEIRTFADGIGQAFDTVVVLGIGGSALGTTALREALRPPAWNELDDEAREYYPRLFVLDNVDPSGLHALLGRIDLRRTLFNVVSKSGTTAETMAQFLIVRERLARVMADDRYRRHFLFTTDPERGVLRRIADDEGIVTLPIPSSVGGRFSVLSAVGLLPTAMVGVEVEELLAGARDMDERCRTGELEDNPAGRFAALQHAAHVRADAPIHVMMAYSDGLAAVADWFRQLWAESLGKRRGLDGEELFTGPTPVKALGATDQHSQVQLYMEGPFDKTVTFLNVRSLPVDVPIPAAYADIEALGYLGGHTLGELLHAEQSATARALAEAGRMNMTLELPDLGAHSVGQLLMMLEIATVYAGAFYGVNPLDQPGVELGKRLTYELMGRPGYGHNR